ncbi:TonB-dependent receptor domain-containing protein [Roseovarius indicus]|uniref:TonB-dependent heme receptor A n=2 Tax=Roseovarius indicus TaxID=540747 RepID=A0A5P3AGS1_9RHOB|nr:TonB-dependent receptor [Roseovarius indicus]QEW28421.1 TonB-dependent heme receptor A precursor [Roseovarius indicus]SFE11060.1 hemoglobin/transferrin/lactoferrin receptor protein [Roseovarius indicus]
MTRGISRALMGTTALCVTWIGASPAMAQDMAEGPAGFLGTITLQESKRDVRTDTATAITEIDETEIKDRQAGTVAELIDSVPGVNLVNGTRAQGSGINIRGFGATGTYGTDQKVLIQVDGVTRGSEELYRIGNQLFTDPALYKQVEVIRGTVGSFEYGSGVVGGAVLLETKDASDFTGGEPGFAFRQMLEFSTNGEGIANSSILAWQPTEKLEFLVNYTNRQLGIQEDGDGNPINPAGGDINDPSYMVKGKLTFGADDAHSLTASYTNTDSTQYNVPYDAFGLGTGFGFVDRETSSETAMLRYGYNPAGNDLVDLSLQFSYANEEIMQTPVPGTPPFLVGLIGADHKYETTTVTLKNRSYFDTGPVAHNLVSGMEYIYRKRLDASSAPGGDDNRWAFFLIDEMAFGGGWTVTPAVRYETSDISGTTAPNNGQFSNEALMGGVSVRYAFGNGISVFGSAAYTEVLPPIDDLDNVARVSTTEKSRTFEIGAAYEGQDLFSSGDTLSLKANIYDTELWDVTSYVSATPMGQQLLDEVHTQGIEVEGSYAMQNGFYTDVNATITEAEQTDAVFVTQDWGLQAGNSLRVTVGKKWGDALDLSWETEMNESVTNTFGYTPGYAVHNLRATVAPKEGVWEGTEFRVGVENLFDQNYRTPLMSPGRRATGRNFKVTIAKAF